MIADKGEILSKIGPQDIVVDIGGWFKPLKRANKIIDILPYETRVTENAIGDADEEERYTRSDWIVRDLCDRAPFPFRDKEVDFVFCSQTLEDIRDPIWVCSEIVRIGKRGYIEIPSRALETTRGIEKWQYTGFYHHRWLIERDGNGTLVFTAKTPALLKYPRYHLNLSVSPSAVGFFWEGSFNFKENIIIDKKDVFKDLEDFVRSEKQKMHGGERFLNGLLSFVPDLLLTVLFSPNARRRRLGV
jgi:Methyltransferase domain